MFWISENGVIVPKKATFVVKYANL